MSFFPKKIYYEENILNYPLGIYLLDKYINVDKVSILNHNNILELREYNNDKFVLLKKYLIIGVRRSLKYVKNNKTSDYLVPYTSSGCSAMCLYCYLVCHYNKCSYLRIFVNVDDMLNKLINTSLKSEGDLVFEIGSNSDLILENLITNNLDKTITEFGKINKGYITFPTKFCDVDSILNLEHNGRCIVRMSINPEYIITNIEIGTSHLLDRINAINKLVNSGYKVGIIIAPVILLDDYKLLYEQMLLTLLDNLSDQAKNSIFFEVIFMTYSYVHDKINTDAFKNAIEIFDRDKMRGKGMGKYMYKSEYLDEGKEYIENLIKKYFTNDIKYIV